MCNLQVDIPATLGFTVSIRGHAYIRLRITNIELPVVVVHAVVKVNLTIVL